MVLLKLFMRRTTSAPPRHHLGYLLGCIRRDVAPGCIAHLLRMLACQFALGACKLSWIGEPGGCCLITDTTAPSAWPRTATPQQATMIDPATTPACEAAPWATSTMGSPSWVVCKMMPRPPDPRLITTSRVGADCGAGAAEPPLGHTGLSHSDHAQKTAPTTVRTLEPRQMWFGRSAPRER